MPQSHKSGLCRSGRRGERMDGMDGKGKLRKGRIGRKEKGKIREAKSTGTPLAVTAEPQAGCDPTPEGFVR